MLVLGQWLGEKGESEEAETLLQGAVDMRKRLLGDTHPHVMVARVALGDLMVEQGRTEEGCTLADGTLEALSEALGDDHWRTAVARSLTGACQAARGDREAAEASLLQSLKQVHKKQTLARLVQLYETWGRKDEADKYSGLLASEVAGG
jgi:thioredoxin-like negative regulator of GroEL